MIQIERRALGSLEQHTLSVSKGLDDLETRIRGELPQALLAGLTSFLSLLYVD